MKIKELREMTIEELGTKRRELKHEMLNLRIQHLRFRSNFDDVKWDRAAAEHTQMVAALEARDATGLASIMRHHLQQKGEAVLEAMRAHRPAGAVAR